MITPDEIRGRATKLWASGQVLRAAFCGEPAFPWPVTFRKPSAGDWLQRFAELRGAVAKLEAESKAATGTGYTLALRDVEHRKLGRLRTPEGIFFDSPEDVAACAGEAATLRTFRALAADLCASEPRLAPWVARQPFALLEHAAAVPRLLAVAAHLQQSPRPQRFARELGIPGVDSKFIEAHRALLAEWLDGLLPEAHIDASVRGLAAHGFERRYGLRHEEQQVRFRWLDPARLPGGSLRDLAVPLGQFADYAPSCEHVFVTENKISFLTLPDCRGSLVIFGEGYAIDRLAGVPWLAGQPLHYWGDIDTHGFAILSRLRGYWPGTRSFLMDRETLLSHRELWSQEPQERRCLIDLPGLEAEEAALYDDLRSDVLAKGVRLEQERVVFERVVEAVRAAAVTGAR